MSDIATRYEAQLKDVYRLSLNRSHMDILDRSAALLVSVATGRIEEAMPLLPVRPTRLPTDPQRLERGRSEILHAKKVLCDLDEDAAHDLFDTEQVSNKARHAYEARMIIGAALEADRDASEFEITLTGAQMRALESATDLMSRIMIGQLREVLDYAPIKDGHVVEWHVRRKEAAERILNQALYEICDLTPSSSFGIHNRTEVKDDARISWDLQKVLRHRLAWDLNPEGGFGNQYDTPMRCGAEELARAVRLDNDGNPAPKPESDTGIRLNRHRKGM